MRSTGRLRVMRVSSCRDRVDEPEARSCDAPACTVLVAARSRRVAAPDSLKSEKKYRDLKILINRAPEYLAATTFTTVLVLHVYGTGNHPE